MPTFKGLIIPSNRKQDGTWNVKIRVTHHGKSRFLPTPFYVTQNQLTRGYKIKDAKINDQIDEKIKGYRCAVANIGFMADSLDIDHLIRLIQNQETPIDFFVFADIYINRLIKNERIGTAKVYITAINSLKLYNKNKPLYFSQISAGYMYDYFQSIQHLKTYTVRSYISSIRRIYNAAELQYNDDDANIIIVKHGVFKLIELPRAIDDGKEAFAREQMQAIIDTPYTGTWIYDFAKDMFILSFVCFGINPKDLLFAKKNQCKDGILTYRRQKVANRLGKDAEMKIKLPHIAQIIIDKYSGGKEYLIDFQNHTRRTEICRYIHATFQNAGLEPQNKIEKTGVHRGRYDFYTARRTMATLARNECGVDFMIVLQMLNHATPQNFKTTDVYIQKNFSPLWEANEKLLALFDWSFYLNQRKE